MIDVTFTVKMVDGAEHTTRPRPFAYVLTERRFKKPSAELFGSPSIEVLAYVAYEGLKMDGVSVKPFDDWLRTDVADVLYERGDGDGPFTETEPSSS